MGRPEKEGGENRTPALRYRTENPGTGHATVGEKELLDPGIRRGLCVLGSRHG